MHWLYLKNQFQLTRKIDLPIIMQAYVISVRKIKKMP